MQKQQGTTCESFLQQANGHSGIGHTPLPGMVDGTPQGAPTAAGRGQGSEESTADCSPSRCLCERSDEPMAFCWRSAEEATLLGLWGHTDGENHDSTLSMCWVSGQQLSALCQEVPHYGSWFCSRCCSFSGERSNRCSTCGADFAECLAVVGSKPRRPPMPRRPPPPLHQEQPQKSAVCATPVTMQHTRSGGGRAEVPGGRGHGGQPVAARDPGDVAALKVALSSAWFVEQAASQRWTWGCEGDDHERGTIEFCPGGVLRTTWGCGCWARLPCGDVQAAFGSPLCAWRLRRTLRGFRATIVSGTSSSEWEGSPAHGKVPRMRLDMALRALACAAWLSLPPALRRLASRRGRTVAAVVAVAAALVALQRRRRRQPLLAWSSKILRL